MKCPNCDFVNPVEMRFCGMCGTSLKIDCPACQFVNPVNYRFCGMCGTPLLFDASSRSAPVQRTQQQTTQIRAAGQPAIVPAQVASDVPTYQLSGERRVASVIFADVKGSTELLEKIGTEAWVEVMNNVFQVLESEIYRYGGEVGQFRGDGLVAFFGTRAANEDDPEHAVLAALAIQAAIKPLAKEMSLNSGIELEMRVGVNTGDVIVASVGDAQYSEDTAMGEALTIASRMESSAEPGTVLVSDYTYRLVHDRFDWQPLGDIVVKGISNPISVFRPLAPRRSVEPGQETQPYGLFHGLIGRKNEFQVLKKSIDDLHLGRGGIVLVTGVKGMGKSFLVNQVRQHYIRQNALLAAAQSIEPSPTKDATAIELIPSIRWFYGRCRSYGHLRPYSMWLDLMHEWLGTHSENKASEVEVIQRAASEIQWDSDVEKDYPNLATFLSTPNEETATERTRHLDAEGNKREFFRTIRDWIRQLAQERPVVLTFTDVQWADPTSLDLLDNCLPLCNTEPVLWLLVYRPERASAIWDFQHHVETEYPHRSLELTVPPLSSAESKEFIDQFLGQDVLQPETCDLVIKKAEGNPFFIKELIYSLIAQGALSREENWENWRQVRPVTSLDLPDSLQSLLMARIDRLSADERRVLQMAAVVGSTFWVNALQALSGSGIPLHQLQTNLVALERAGLVHERAQVEDLGMEYTFDSSLIREVAYESLLNTQRTAYHLRVAEYLEEIVFREGKRRYFNTLAHHYRQAGDVKKELFYTLQAAERAKNIYANAEALHYYTRALALLEEIEETLAVNGHQQYAIWTQKFEALDGRRAVNFLIGNIDAGWEDARALLPLARKMDQDPTWLIDALLQQPGVSSVDNHEELLAGANLAQEALDLAQKIGDKRREMNCLLAIASQLNLLNDANWTRVGDRALILSREIGDRQYEAMILLGLGHAYIGRDELQKGMSYLNAALPICQELDDQIAKMTLLHVLGAQQERNGDHYRRLVDYEQKRLMIAREIGNRFEEGNSLMFCGQIQALNLGDLDGGLSLLSESMKILELVSGRIFPLLRIAQVHVAMGQFENAQMTLENAQPIAAKNVYDLSRVGLKLVTILLYNALGDLSHLILSLEIAAEIMAMEKNQLVSRQYRMAAACKATETHLQLSRLSTDESDRQIHFQKALENSQIALEIYKTLGYINIIECSCEEIYLRHSQALAANRHPSEASDYLELAYMEMMRKYELIPEDSHFRRTYLENIDYHREIRASHMASTLAKISAVRYGKK